MSFFDLSASKTRARARLFSNSSIPRHRVAGKNFCEKPIPAERGDPLLTLLLVQTSMIPWGFAADASRSRAGVDLLVAGPGRGLVSEQVGSEVSEDALLVGAARDGDRAAFGRLYDRYARIVHAVLLTKVPVARWMTSFRMSSSWRSVVCRRCGKSELWSVAGGYRSQSGE